MQSTRRLFLERSLLLAIGGIVGLSVAQAAPRDEPHSGKEPPRKSPDRRPPEKHREPERRNQHERPRDQRDLRRHDDKPSPPRGR